MYLGIDYRVSISGYSPSPKQKKKRKPEYVSNDKLNAIRTDIDSISEQNIEKKRKKKSEIIHLNCMLMAVVRFLHFVFVITDTLSFEIVEVTEANL